MCRPRTRLAAVCLTVKEDPLVSVTRQSPLTVSGLLSQSLDFGGNLFDALPFGPEDNGCDEAGLSADRNTHVDRRVLSDECVHPRAVHFWHFETGQRRRLYYEVVQR